MADDRRWRRDGESGDEDEEEVVDETVNPLKAVFHSSIKTN